MLIVTHSPRPTTTPTRVFTVPDDCSTDDNEPIDEEPIDEEPLPSYSKGPAEIDLEDKPCLAADSCHSPPTSIPQGDGIIDLVSTPGDTDSRVPDLVDGGEMEEEEEEQHVFDKSIGVLRGLAAHYSDDDDESLRLTNDEMSSGPGSLIDSLDESDIPHLADHDLESPVPTWNSISSSSEGDDIDMDMDEDEDEDGDSDLKDFDHNSEDGSPFLRDHESEIDNGSRKLREGDSHSGSDSEPETPEQNKLRQPLMSEMYYGDSLPRRLPPLNSVIPSGQWSLNSPTANLQYPRLPSPSDAVLPHGNRRMELVEVETNHNNAGQQVPEAENIDAHHVRSTVETLGQKSGKVDFFEAREHNKMTIARLTEQSPQPDAAASRDVPTKQASWIAAPQPDYHISPVPVFVSETHNTEIGAREVMNNMPDLVYPEIAAHNPGNDAFVPGLAPLLQRGNEDVLSKGASWTAFAPSDWEPSSAYELQQLKQRGHSLLARGQPKQQIETQDVQSATTLDFPFTNSGGTRQEDLEDRQNFPLFGQSSTTETRKNRKGKRKADLISEMNEAEVIRATSDLPDILSEALAEESPANPSEAASLPPPSLHQTHTHSPLPSPPTTPEMTSPEARPAKRIKKIAERVGYAALGGATVGAMVLTSLIYSAPTFV